MDVDLQELCSLARQAGEIARGYFRNASSQRKSDNSWVTEADVTVEQWLVERLCQRYPEAGLIGEEQIRTSNGQEYVWAIDPIDGTACFVAGLPIWGVSIGLLRAGQPYLGVFYMPICDDLYWCEPAGRAYRNATPIQVAEPRPWDGEDWITIPSNSHRRYSISFPGKARSLGSIVADLCYIAAGSSIGSLVSRCAIWDLAAGMAILKRAGGSYVGLSGAPVDLGAMLTTGKLLPEPMVAGHPDQLAHLRAQIQVHQ